MQTNDRYMPVSLTHAQRRAIADLFPQMEHRLRLDAQGRPRIDFRVGELQSILWCAGDALSATRRMRRGLPNWRQADVRL